MSDEPQSRGKLVVLAIFLLACGGVLAWTLTRPPTSEVPESIEDKASRLTELVQEAEGDRDENWVDSPAPANNSGPVNKREAMTNDGG